MFRQRLITTLTLIPLALFSIYYLWPTLLGCAVLALAVIGGWEWSRLTPILTNIVRAIFIIIVILLVWPCFKLLFAWASLSLFVWLFILTAVVTFPASQRWWGKPLIVGGLGLYLLPLFTASLAAIYLMPNGKDLIVYLFLIVWAADVGAYLTGKAFGKIKLIPQVSPGKTIEGVMGGISLSIIVSIGAYFYFNPLNPWFWFILAGFTASISVLGDLFISILKRRCQMKDSGQLFPGHGGMLDRFDSLIAALPIYFLGMTYMPFGA